MRVHQLEIEAFGAFVERQVIDVDELSAQHLFLLHGETGAGKTTVLDALCFGLYGEVPGVRNGAAHLRSDHAPPHAEPRVTVEVTVSGRRFRLTRTPKWLRPKKRGAGTTTANASVTLIELIDGEPVHLSSRIDETNQLMVDLIGLTREQFCQVVLLPQGQFASFLRAGSDERRTLLQKIFSTGRFADIERWLVDRRVEAKRASDQHHNTVRGVLSRLTEAAGAAWPDAWPTDDVADQAASGELIDHADDLVSATDLVRRHAEHACAHAEAEADAARAAHADATRLADLAVRARSARTVLSDLDARSEELAASRERVAAARRARPIVDAHAHARRASATAAEATRAADEAAGRAREAVAHHAAPVSRSASHSAHDGEHSRVDAALRRAMARHADAEALVAVERERSETERRSAALERECSALTTEIGDLESDLADLPDQRRQLAASREELVPLVEARAGRAVEAKAAADRLAAAADAVVRAEEVIRAEDAVRDLRDTAADRRHAWQECRERRFAGMASEIALKLAVGHGCPVCGSCEHPSPASAAQVEETRAAEESARSAYDDATMAHAAAEQHLAGLRSHRDAALRASGGLDEPTARREHAEAARLLQEADEAARTSASLQTRLAELDDRLRRAESEIAGKRSLLAARTATLEAAREQLQAATLRIEQTISLFAQPGDGSADPDADDRAVDLADPGGAEVWSRRFAHHIETLRSYADALLRLASAEQHDAEARERLDAAVDASDFAGLDDALAAQLDEAAVDRLAAELERAGQARHTAEATLAEMPPEVDEVLSGRTPVPDVPQLAQRLRTAEHAHRAAAATAAAALARHERVELLSRELAASVDDWTPLREQHRLVGELASTAEGKGPDNPLQMRLSAYVLASRLSQVVAAANERLSSMAEERYELEHTAFKGAGDRRGGLSLRVVDAWTGESRDPATLSGGETFMVALALALGLADVVTAEAGGAEIETLFVDEGFGSLDAHTLDRVMDCLDDLRSGGRSVGVVSHVAELRDRIPDQLHVVKTPKGSQVRMTSAAVAAAC